MVRLTRQDEFSTPRHEKLGSSDIFKKDRRGDRQNLVYGSLPRHAVPHYRLSGKGNTVGLGRDFRTLSRSDDKQGVSKNDKDVRRKYRDENFFTDLPEKIGEQMTSMSKEASEAHFQQDYISINERGSKKRRRLQSLGFRPKNESQTDDDDSDASLYSDYGQNPVGESNDDAYEDFRSNSVQQRHRQLLQSTIDQPENIDIWLALVSHQEVMNGTLSSEQQQHKQSQKHIVIDLKISIYERALTKVSNRVDRDRLIAGLLEEGSKIWDNKRQAAEWERYIKAESSFDLLIAYENFIQTNTLDFSFDKCLDLFTGQLKRFSAYPASVERDSRCMYLLLRSTLLMLQAGYVERAVATWQAILELNFTDKTPHIFLEEVDAFEAFWDSEKLRFGELGATDLWHDRNEEILSNDRLRISNDPENPHTLWAAAEINAADIADMPAKSLDNIDENDPYRIVIFPDIKQFLFKISSNQKIMLIYHFLSFCGLHSFSYNNITTDASQDAFTFQFRLLYSHHEDSINPSNMANFLVNAQLDSWILFAPTQGFFNIWGGKLRFRDQLNSKWIQQALQQLARTCWSEDLLGEYVTALMLSIEPKNARKLAKSLLKKNTTSLRLYNAYAYVEDRMGDRESAERVRSTALKMSNSLNESEKCDAVVLWSSWIWECIDASQFSKAEMLLLMILDGQIDPRHLKNTMIEDWKTATAYLKAERIIQEQLSKAIVLQHQRIIPIYTDLLALLKYLENDRYLPSALAVYSSTLESISHSAALQKSYVLELLHQYRARFLHAHVDLFRTTFRPKDILSSLQESLALFPTNSVLYFIHKHYEKKAGIFDKIHNRSARACLEVKPSRSIIPYVLTIISEFARPTFSGTITHSIRSAFCKAIAFDSPARNCPSIWKAFILWETSISSSEAVITDKSRTKASRKAVETFHSAIRACPWAKELYMLAFTEKQLRHDLGDEVLNSLLESMLERGLRIHVDIPDLLLSKA